MQLILKNINSYYYNYGWVIFKNKMADWRLPFSHVDNNSRIRRARSRSPQRERIWPSVQRGYDREYPSTSWSSGESWDYNQWRQHDSHYYHDEIYYPARESYYPEESEPFSYDRRGWYPQHSRFSEYSPGFFQNDDVPRQARRLPNDISRQLRRPQDETVRGRLPDDIPRPIRQLPGGITWRQNSDGISQHVKRPPDYITQQVKRPPNYISQQVKRPPDYITQQVKRPPENITQQVKRPPDNIPQQVKRVPDDIPPTSLVSSTITTAKPFEEAETLPVEALKKKEEGLPFAENSNIISVTSRMRCSLCNITTTSVAHLESHYKGIKHLKMVRKKGNGGTSETSDKMVKIMVCSVCGQHSKSDDLNIESHVETERHKTGLERSVKRHRSIPEMQELFVEVSLSEKDVDIVLELEKNPEGYYCEVCDITMRAYEGYQQHVKGQKHHKLLRKVLNCQDDDVETHYCDVCDIYINTRDSYQRHLEGQKHKKLLRNKDHEMASGLYCDTCRIVCTSYVDLESHCKGKQHQQKLQKQKQFLSNIS